MICLTLLLLGLGMTIFPALADNTSEESAETAEIAAEVVETAEETDIAVETADATVDATADATEAPVEADSGEIITIEEEEVPLSAIPLSVTSSSESPFSARTVAGFGVALIIIAAVGWFLSIEIHAWRDEERAFARWSKDIGSDSPSKK